MTKGHFCSSTSHQIIISQKGYWWLLYRFLFKCAFSHIQFNRRVLQNQQTVQMCWTKLLAIQAEEIRNVFENVFWCKIIFDQFILDILNRNTSTFDVMIRKRCKTIRWKENKLRKIWTKSFFIFEDSHDTKNREWQMAKPSKAHKPRKFICYPFLIHCLIPFHLWNPPHHAIYVQMYTVHRAIDTNMARSTKYTNYKWRDYICWTPWMNCIFDVRIQWQFVPMSLSSSIFRMHG